MINGPRSKDLRIPSWQLTYPLRVWYFCVDDFPNFPFGGSHVIVPWRVGQIGWEFVTATGLPLATWGEKIQQVAPAGSAQRFSWKILRCAPVRFVCLGYETQKGGNPSGKLTGCHPKNPPLFLLNTIKNAWFSRAILFFSGLVWIWVFRLFVRLGNLRDLGNSMGVEKKTKQKNADLTFNQPKFTTGSWSRGLFW